MLHLAFRPLQYHGPGRFHCLRYACDCGTWAFPVWQPTTTVTVHQIFTARPPGCRYALCTWPGQEAPVLVLDLYTVQPQHVSVQLDLAQFVTAMSQDPQVQFMPFATLADAEMALRLQNHQLPTNQTTPE